MLPLEFSKDEKAAAKARESALLPFYADVIFDFILKRMPFLVIGVDVILDNCGIILVIYSTRMSFLIIL